VRKNQERPLEKTHCCPRVIIALMEVGYLPRAPITGFNEEGNFSVPKDSGFTITDLPA